VVSVVFGFFGRPLIPLTDGFVFRHIHLSGGDYGRVRIGGSVTFIAVVGLMEFLGVGGSGAGRLILIAMAVAGAVQLVSILGLPRDRPAVAPAAKTGRRGPGLRLFLARGFVMFAIAAFLGRVAMTSYYHFFSLFVKRDLGYDCPGLLWALGPLSEIPMIYFSTRAVKRVGVKTLFALGLVGIVVRLGCFSMVTSVWQVVPLQFLHALTFGAYHTASVTYVSRLAPPDMRSSAQTVFHAVTLGFGGLVGGTVGGQIAEQFGFRTLYMVYAGVAVVALAVMLLFVPSDRGASATETPRH
jgi:PPP family 3-phenylpropionic acid transporter